MLPKDIITLIYQYKTAILVYEINTEIKSNTRCLFKPNVITLTPASANNVSVGIIMNTKNIIGTNLDLKKKIFRKYTYFCTQCGEYLSYYPNTDSFSCDCDFYHIVRY